MRQRGRKGWLHGGELGGGGSDPRLPSGAPSTQGLVFCPIRPLAHLFCALVTYESALPWLPVCPTRSLGLLVQLLALPGSCSAGQNPRTGLKSGQDHQAPLPSTPLDLGPPEPEPPASWAYTSS